MATVVETQQCFPKPIILGNTMIGAPEPDHEHCSGGYTIRGVMGGWVCPCACHTGDMPDSDRVPLIDGKDS